MSEPVLMVTGTRDTGRDGDWRTRLSAFEGLPPGRKRLAVIPGAGHLQLGGFGGGLVPRTVEALVGEFAEDVARGTRTASRVEGAEVTDE